MTIWKEGEFIEEPQDAPELPVDTREMIAFLDAERNIVMTTKICAENVTRMSDAVTVFCRHWPRIKKELEDRIQRIAELERDAARWKFVKDRMRESLEYDTYEMDIPPMTRAKHTFTQAVDAAIEQAGEEA